MPSPQLIFSDYPDPKRSRDNQFAPFRAGVNKLIFRTKKHFYVLKRIYKKINNTT
jgi:hypothetical protein